MRTFTIHTIDAGDADDAERSDYGQTVWVAAYIDGDTTRGIGAYVTVDGEIETDDHIAWRIENDLVNLGIEPESDQADALLAEWFPVAKRAGLDALAKISDPS